MSYLLLALLLLVTPIISESCNVESNANFCTASGCTDDDTDRPFPKADQLCSNCNSGYGMFSVERSTEDTGICVKCAGDHTTNCD